MPENHSIVIIDPEETIRDILHDYFGELGYRVYLASTVDEGINIVSNGAASIVLADEHMSSGNYLDAIDRLRQACSGLRIIFLTGSPTIAKIIMALRHDVFDIIVKPFSLCDMQDVIERALAPTSTKGTMENLRGRIRMLENLLNENGIKTPDKEESLKDIIQKGMEEIVDLGRKNVRHPVDSDR